MPEKDVLRGWGAIESFLGISRKTIMRRGYPVRREAQGEYIGLGGVFALRTELLDFMKKSKLCIVKK